MSNGRSWEVDTINNDRPLSAFDVPFRIITKESRYEWEPSNLYAWERREICEAFLELVAEIEALQTENIELRDDYERMVNVADYWTRSYYASASRLDKFKRLLNGPIPQLGALLSGFCEVVEE